MSVRNFRVAGIRGLLNSDDVVTIQTAVQVAMEYQLLGMEAQAELIYRLILSESPAYPDALHLLGVIFYQKGDALAAVPYIERALQSNQSFEGFHNSLGETDILFSSFFGFLLMFSVDQVYVIELWGGSTKLRRSFVWRLHSILSTCRPCSIWGSLSSS